MRQVQARMEELGEEALEEQLQTAVENAERRTAPDFRLTRLLTVSNKHSESVSLQKGLMQLSARRVCVSRMCIKYVH